MSGILAKMQRNEIRGIFLRRSEQGFVNTQFLVKFFIMAYNIVLMHLKETRQLKKNHCKKSASRPVARNCVSICGPILI